MGICSQATVGKRSAWEEPLSGRTEQDRVSEIPPLAADPWARPESFLGTASLRKEAAEGLSHALSDSVAKGREGAGGGALSGGAAPGRGGEAARGTWAV